jgi:hypothetical protein
LLSKGFRLAGSCALAVPATFLAGITARAVSRWKRSRGALSSRRSAGLENSLRGAFLRPVFPFGSRRGAASGSWYRQRLRFSRSVVGAAGFPGVMAGVFTAFGRFGEQFARCVFLRRLVATETVFPLGGRCGQDFRVVMTGRIVALEAARSLFTRLLVTAEVLVTRRVLFTALAGLENSLRGPCSAAAGMVGVAAGVSRST